MSLICGWYPFHRILDCSWRLVCLVVGYRYSDRHTNMSRMILGGIRITLWFYAIYKYPRNVAKTKHSAMVNEWKKDVDCQLMTYVECMRV